MPKKKYTQLFLPSDEDRHVRWGRLYACAQAEAVVRFVEDNKLPVLLIAPDMTRANQFEAELHFFSQGKSEIFLLPNWETLPYDELSPRGEIIAKRLDRFRHLSKFSNGICVVAIDTLLQYVVPPKFINEATFSLTVGDTLNFEDFCRKLADNCYTSVSQVTSHGEYAVRGSVIDFYSPANNLPVRVDLFDDKIESLRLFSPEDQVSVEKLNSVLLQPARELILNQTTIKTFRHRFRATMENNDTRLYHDISAGIIPSGVEYYLPLFFDKMATFFDYLPDNTCIFLPKGLAEYTDKYWKLIRQRYKQAQLNPERPLLPPEYLFLNEEILNKQIAHFKSVEIQSFESSSKKDGDGGTRLLPTLFVQSQVKQPLANLEKFLEEFNGRVLITAKSRGYHEQLLDMLRKIDKHAHIVENWSEFCKSDKSLCICIGDIHTGVEFEHKRLAIASDNQILGRQSNLIRHKSKRTPDANAIIHKLDDLTIGCPVVHEEHGVGRYCGLEYLDIGGNQFEFLTLEYADKNKLYVPISSLHLVTRYTGGGPETAPLHSLGGEQWKKAKRKAAQKAFDVAAELLDTHARRTTVKSAAFEIDDASYLEFTSSFPYEETPDQLKVMDEIRIDMERDQPMDRIVCGDVGFGKTEIAMRAAFIALHNNQQVVVLVPTTLLATQHFNSFISRFADWGVRIEMLSRFVSRTQQQQIIKKFSASNIDIMIGTHRLLARDIPYKKLGLIIIDEEQRFGVRHKERLKASVAKSNLLTLTATPIPRTLNMSLSGLRDLSLVTTPPPDRRAIKTFVNEWSNALVCEICQREMHRGGQIYFVHNRVEQIEEMTKQLRKLLPDMDIRFAHGQMLERDLESVMLNFYRHRFDMLVCTTIIESGIDIPLANSIIINKADHFGLAQLHQLRGRVGRSHYQAYAYLAMSRPQALLSEDARKRLEAVESLEKLGTGFTLAMHDLEIRGAGDLLGEGQSGHIQEIGFTMYNDLLKRAVETLRSGKIPNADESLNIMTEVNLGKPALFPENYIPDVNLRLILYRRLAAITNNEELAKLKREIIDRFSLMPEYSLNLFENAKIRLKCLALNILRIEISAKNGHIQFGEKPQIDVNYLIELVRDNPETYRFSEGDKLTFDVSSLEAEDRYKVIDELLDRIAYCEEAA